MEKQIISREAAQSSKLTHFYTGKPCKHGHDAERFVSTGGCTACSTARAAKFRKDAPAMFSYALHPDDVATVLAVCQACDLQRGRVPLAQGQVRVGGQAQVTGGPIALPPDLVRIRAQLDAVPAYVPKEMRLPE